LNLRQNRFPLGNLDRHAIRQVEKVTSGRNGHTILEGAASMFPREVMKFYQLGDGGKRFERCEDKTAGDGVFSGLYVLKFQQIQAFLQ
jgi:hypothetical protein